MEHCETVLFSVERTLQRRYPSKHLEIRRETIKTILDNPPSAYYCALRMAQALKMEVIDLAGFYTSALREAEREEEIIQLQEKERRRAAIVRIVWSGLSGLIAVGALLGALAAGVRLW